MKFAPSKVLLVSWQNKEIKNPSPEQTSFSASPRDVCWLHWCLCRVEPGAPCALPGESCRVLAVPPSQHRAVSRACLRTPAFRRAGLQPHHTSSVPGTGLARSVTSSPHGEGTHGFRRRKRKQDLLRDLQMTCGGLLNARLVPPCSELLSGCKEKRNQCSHLWSGDTVPGLSNAASPVGSCEPCSAPQKDRPTSENLPLARGRGQDT